VAELLKQAFDLMRLAYSIARDIEKAIRDGREESP